jgi:hypothetical protein
VVVPFARRHRQESGRVAARKFNDLRLRPLRHEPLKVRIDHSVMHGNYCVADLATLNYYVFPVKDRLALSELF